MTRGLVTGTKINVLGVSDMLWTVNYYDEDGRAIKTFKQHYKGNTLVAGNYDEITNTYDFTGAVLSSTRSHKVNGTETLKILNEYDYDHMGRKTNTWQQINTDAKVLLVKNTYDDMGKLYKKSLHSVNGGSTFLENIKYKYNMAGWLVGAKAGALDMELRYNYPQHGAAEQYNGNISEVEYTAAGSGNKYFKYTYDDQNRLTYSDYSDPGKELNEEIAYDKAGNITSLKRGPSSNAAITYNYITGNQLSSLSGSKAGSFTYDANGNVITDGTRSVSSIVYNQLNLPKTVTITGGTPTANYIYDATGTKLRSVQSSIVRDYVSGIQYNGSGVIDFVATEEGRAVRNTDGTYRYEYNLKDNLGNVRVTIDNGPSGRRVVQEDEYYAFGLSKNRSTSGDKNNYLYNGKELQDVLTDEYDYGARFYDPVIGRWHVVDPLAEQSRRFSPYVYADDNPIRFIDPDGMQTVDPLLPISAWNFVINAAKTAAVGVEVVGTGLATAVAATVTLVFLPQNGTGAGSDQGPSWKSPVIPPPAIPNLKSDKSEDSSNNNTGDGQGPTDRELPRAKNGEPTRDPEASDAGPHTQLGKKEGRNGDYKQGREWDGDGNVVKDIDHTDHGRPNTHPDNPHQHRYLPNKTGGTPQRSKKPEPLDFGYKTFNPFN